MVWDRVIHKALLLYAVTLGLLKVIPLGDALN